MNPRTHSQGILDVAFTTPNQPATPGLHPLGFGSERDGLLYIPQEPADGPHPLVVLLHGAGADAPGIVHILSAEAERHGCVLLVPESRGATWDLLRGGFGPDVEFIQRALLYTSARCRIDPSKVAIAGFSDGASYALTLGLTNGILFTHIIAFSPGFMAAASTEDAPRIYISHGVHDNVLPISRCSRRVVPLLQQAGYDVTYREFDGPHTVPPDLVRDAMHWFLAPVGRQSIGATPHPG